MLWDVPTIYGILNSLTPEPNSPIWGELWDRVYHQGTTYSASPYVLPYLLNAAASWAAPGRIMPLALASAIIASPEFRSLGFEGTVEDLAALARETLGATDISRADRIYVMSSVLTFTGDLLWGPALEHLNDEELPGVCPSCACAIYFQIGDEGCYTVKDFNLTADSRRETIVPCKVELLTGVAKWLHQVAIDCADLELARRIRCVFGSSVCVDCNSRIDVSEAIERFERPVHS